MRAKKSPAMLAAASVVLFMCATVVPASASVMTDITPPTITVTTPPIPPATYTQDEVVLADFECADAESGIASCEGSIAWANESVPMVDGQPIDTSRLSTVIGPNASWTVVATDNAGNTRGVDGGYYVADPEPFTGRFGVNISTEPDGQSQYVNGWGWKHGPVTIYLGDGWGNPVGTAPIGGDAGESGFFSMVDPGTFAPGDTVKVMDAVGNFKSLLVANLAVTSIDPLTGDVAGTCDVGMTVNLEYSTDDAHPFPTQLVVPCTEGTFEASFSPNELPNYPEGSYVEARQFDDDGDGTQVDAWYPQYPDSDPGFFSMEASVYGNWIHGQEWDGDLVPGDVAHVVVTDVDGTNVILDTTVPVTAKDPGPGGEFNLDSPFPLQPGMTITATASGITKVLTLVHLTIDNIDGGSGVVTGTAPPNLPAGEQGQTLHVDTDLSPDPRGYIEAWPGTDDEGDWTVNFGEPLVPGADTGADIGDADGDFTIFDMMVPEPFEGIFSVNFSDGGWIFGAGWGGPVTVTVDGKKVMTITDMNSECNNWVTPLCFSERFVSEPGQHVVVSDGVNQKDLYLADVSITTIDVPTGRVTGTCSVGPDVLLANGVGEELEFACEDGTFEKFFEPSFGWTSHVKVVQRDDDGDWTKDETSFFYDEDGLFWGFFSPVNYDEVNIAKAGRSIPVQWWLLDGEGVPVSNPASFFSITSSGAACGSEPTDAIEEYAVGGSGIQYLGDGYWQFNWKTLKSYAGQCRTVTLTLLDGSNLTADFMFTK